MYVVHYRWELKHAMILPCSHTRKRNTKHETRNTKHETKRNETKRNETVSVCASFYFNSCVLFPSLQCLSRACLGKTRSFFMSNLEKADEKTPPPSCPSVAYRLCMAAGRSAVRSGIRECSHRADVLRSQAAESESACGTL